ncbi:MAG: MFS transporter [Flavobacteriales bacterium]|nr:MFS transporter [Flavobacteriales bacterium]
MLSWVDKRAFSVAVVVVLSTIFLVYIGSRDLQNYDAALVAYLFGTLFAVFGVAYRYTVWILRPPTKKYFKTTLSLIFSREGVQKIAFIVKDFFNNILFQRFIFQRSKKRGLAHFAMAFGCTMAFAITVPLTFGWIHFELLPSSGLDPQVENIYIAHFFGFPVAEFPVHSIMGFFAFTALNWFAILVIVGATYFLQKRLKTPGLIATQTFDGDILPLILLIFVSLTGIGLTLNYKFMEGRAFEFMAVTHAFFVIIFLIWIPFGKFFHIIQRPAQVGAHLYKVIGESKGMQVCKKTGKEYTTKLHVADLKYVTKELGFKLENKEGDSILNYSPEGKRNLLANAHLKARTENGKYFG